MISAMHTTNRQRLKKWPVPLIAFNWIDAIGRQEIASRPMKVKCTIV